MAQRFHAADPEDRKRRLAEPVVSPDPSDPKLAHLDGLNLSRAWMLEGILSALPTDDPRRASAAELRQTRIGAQVSQRLPARITKAGIGSAVLRFISQRSAGSKKKERLRRSRRRRVGKRPRLKSAATVDRFRGEVFLPKACQARLCQNSFRSD